MRRTGNVRKVVVPAVPGILNEPCTVDLQRIDAGHYRAFIGDRYIGTIRRHPRIARRWEIDDGAFPLPPSPTLDDAVGLLVY